MLFQRVLTALLIIVSVLACSSKGHMGRRIDENDTSFSKDIRDISARINKDPENAELYYRRGNTFFYQEKYKDALIDLETSVNLDSSNAVSHHLLAETILKLDTADSRKARYHLEKALKLKSDFADAKLTLSKLYIARQEYKKADDLLKSLTDNQDLADKAFLYLGISKKEQKDTVNALVYFEKAIQSNSNNYEAAMQTALIKAEQNDPLALQYFDRVIAMNEYSDEAFYGKGLLLQKQLKYKDAFIHYEKARTINPGHILATYNTAVLYNLFEDFEKAEEMCNKTLDLAPDYPNALALRGFSYEKRGDKKRAEVDYRKALESDHKNQMAILGLKALGF